MMGALLRQAAAPLDLPILVRTGGFGPGGKPPMQDAVVLLANRGIDVAAHRSTPLTDDVITTADLILTAEREHVVSISARVSGSFDRTFTLPEFTNLGREYGRRKSEDVQSWLDALAAGRARGLDYLSANIAEVDDPTGRPRAEWKRSFDEIDELVRLSARLAV